MSMEYITTDLTAGQRIIALDGFIEPLEYELENNPNKFIDWDMFIAEVADNIVPVWNHERVQWWLDMNLPESDEYSPGVGDGIIDAITFSLYMTVEQFLREVVESLMIDSDTEPTIAEVLGGAIEIRKELGVSKGYADLAKAIIK
jgi:hypothetical protein